MLQGFFRKDKSGLGNKWIRIKMGQKKINKKEMIIESNIIFIS